MRAVFSRFLLPFCSPVVGVGFKGLDVERHGV